MTGAVFDPRDFELEVTSDFEKAPAELLARAHSKVSRDRALSAASNGPTFIFSILQEYIKFVTDLARSLKETSEKKAVPFTPQVHVWPRQTQSLSGLSRTCTRSRTPYHLSSLSIRST